MYVCVSDSLFLIHIIVATIRTELKGRKKQTNSLSFRAIRSSMLIGAKIYVTSALEAIFV